MEYPSPNAQPKRRVLLLKKLSIVERQAKDAFQRAVALNKQYAPATYKSRLLGHAQALQVVFFGINPDKVPAMAVVDFGVVENGHGDPYVTVTTTFCPGTSCNGREPFLMILGENKRAIEVSKQQGFPGSDFANAARSLIEAEIQDQPTLVKPPIDVLRLSLFGPMWVSKKPQCVDLNTGRQRPGQ